MKVLRILLLEDSVLDAELIQAQLQEGGIHGELVRVETQLAFVDALEQESFDLILADYALPSFDGVSALEISQQHCPMIPFIFVSATLGEELAIDMLKQGATDYVLKQRLRRLVPAVQRAFREAQERLEREQAEAALHRREQEFRALVENAPDIIARFDRQFRHIYINPAITKFTGLAPEAYLGKTNAELGSPPELAAVWHQAMEEVFETHAARQLDFSFPVAAETKFFHSRLVPEFNVAGEVESVLCITRDVTETKQAEQALQENEARIRRFIESNMVGMGFWKIDGRITVANDAFLEMVGYSRVDLERGELNWRKMTPVKYRSLDSAADVEAFTRSLSAPFEKELVRKDGSLVPVIIGAHFDGVSEGGFFALDLSDRKQMEEALQQQAEELSRANRIKDEFLAILSHELRSPLNAILGWTRLLRSQRLDEEKTANALEIIERNAKLQTQLIEDLLDVSRILRGKLSLGLVPISLASVVNAAIDTVRLAAEAKSIQVEVSTGAAPFQVLGDPNRLQQVLWNLLSNSVKFTQEGGQVAVHLQQSNAHVQIRVQDTGKGISPEFLPHIFDYFRQADASITRSHGGLGLGLAIARHLIELHGGTIQAESLGEGEGSTFIVTLPLLKTDPEDSPDVSPFTDSDNSILQGLHILIVDDEVDTREIFAFILKHHGAKVTSVGSVREALASFTQAKPDLLVSDIGMPQEDGYALIRQVRAAEVESAHPTPAIALTAYATAEDQNRALAAGFHLHLAKPIEPANLLTAIASLVGKA